MASAFVPFVRAGFEVSTGDRTEAYAAIADRHPVFRITAA